MPVREPRYLYGCHDLGGDQFTIDAGKPGRVLVSEEIGHNLRSTRGKSCQDLADRGLMVIVRLNNGHRPDGTFPAPEQYDDFARRCTFFCRNSNGCQTWIVGNEMNHSQERPGITFASTRTLWQPSRPANGIPRCTWPGPTPGKRHRSYAHVNRETGL